MWLSTLDAMRRELVTDSLVSGTTRGPRPTGYAVRRAPSRCARSAGSTPWLAPVGSTRRELTFEKMLTYANHLGLYSEEIALTGEQIGNFPQAFTHLALIDAALTLDAALERDRRVAAAAEAGGTPAADRIPANGHREPDLPLARSGS